ncbi:MAG: hypothetical protein ALAOOOJD_02217 [bacterium]|nr:hypothetical protein [bacterium]
MTGIEKRGPCSRGHSDVHIDVVADDERIVAAQLEMRFFELLRREHGDVPAGLDTAGERDEIRAFGSDERLAAFFAEPCYNIDDAWREMIKDFCECQRRQRRVFGRFDDDGIAGGQRRCNFPS